jgi:hypothetical protein
MEKAQERCGEAGAARLAAIVRTCCQGREINSEGREEKVERARRNYARIAIRLWPTRVPGTLKTLGISDFV